MSLKYDFKTLHLWLHLLVLGLGNTPCIKGSLKKKKKESLWETASKTLSYIDSFDLRVLSSSRMVLTAVKMQYENYFLNVM